MGITAENPLVLALGAAVILDFRLRIENHCKIFPGNVPKSAAIPDFRGSIRESLQEMPGNSPTAAVIPDFMGSIWQSLQGLLPAQENGPPAA